MSWVIGLMALGLGLVMLEIVIPGGIIGVFGGIAMIGGIIVAYNTFGIEGALITFAVGLAGLSLCLYIEFKVLPKTRLGRRLFLQDRIEGKSQGEVAEADIVGKAGIAATALSPSGYVLVEGKRFEAASRSGFIDKGEAVKVDSLDQFKITVSKN